MKHRRLFIRLAVLLAASLAAEALVFNFRFFLPLLFHAQRVVIPASSFGLSVADQEEGGVIVNTDDSTIEIDNVDKKVFCIRLNCADTTQSFDVKVKMTDDDFSKEEESLGTWTVLSDVPRTETLPIVSSGKCHAIFLTFSKIPSDGAVLSSVEINHPYYYFNILRALLLFFFLALIELIHYFKPWKIPYRRERGFHQILFFAVAAVAIVAATMIVSASGWTDTPHRNIVDQNDKYQLLTNALLHGKIHLLDMPNGKLAELGNPYDYSLRSAKDVSFRWDTAYYRGRYYVYYGIAPVLLLLLPFKVITRYYLPTAVAVLLFVIVALAAMLFSYRKIVEIWFPDTDLLTFLSGAVACAFASNLMWLCGRPYFYELADASGAAFLMLGFYMLLLLVNSTRFTKTKLFLCGLFFACMVGSRPNLVLFIGCSVPFLLVLARGMEKKQILRGAVSLGAPLAVTAAGLMWYNAARFGSPFEFGNKYQLTANDPGLNGVTDVTRLVNGLFQYLFQPLCVNLHFPFFTVTTQRPTNAMQYYYNGSIAGVFAFPFFIILLASIFIIRRMDRGSVKKRFTAILVAVSAALIVVDALLGGVIMRYLIDVLPALAIAAIFLWFEALGYFRKRGAAAPAVRVFCCIALFSSLISLCVCMLGEESSFITSYPEIFQKLSLLFEFWR